MAKLSLISREYDALLAGDASMDAEVFLVEKATFPLPLGGSDTGPFLLV
jgi:hypothetical protein